VPDVDFGPIVEIGMIAQSGVSYIHPQVQGMPIALVNDHILPAQQIAVGAGDCFGIDQTLSEELIQVQKVVLLC
jgi:hypothetical protein